MLVELATHHARRPASSSRVWSDHRKLHDKGVVLLPLLARVSEPFNFMAVRHFFFFSSELTPPVDSLCVVMGYNWEPDKLVKLFAAFALRTKSRPASTPTFNPTQVIEGRGSRRSRLPFTPKTTSETRGGFELKISYFLQLLKQPKWESFWPQTYVQRTQQSVEHSDAWVGHNHISQLRSRLAV